MTTRYHWMLSYGSDLPLPEDDDLRAIRFLPDDLSDTDGVVITRMTTPPAGWYPAPDGSPSEWYWDGAAQWTPNAGPRPVTGPMVGLHQPKKKKSRARVIAVVLVSLAIGGCGVVVFSGSSTPTPDASLACDHYRNVMTDIGKGVLTPAEIRTKIKQVSDDAAIAPTSVQTAATQMLAATTADNGDAFLKSSSAMDSACSAAGS